MVSDARTWLLFPHALTAQFLKPPKRASKKAQPSKPAKPKPKSRSKSKSTPSALRKSTLRKPQPRAAIPSDPEILASFRAYAVSHDELSNPSDLSDEDEDQEDDADSQILRVRDVRPCLRALDIPPPPADFFDDDQRYVRSDEFVALARTMAETVGEADSDADEGDDRGDAAYEDEEEDDEEDPEQAREIDEAFALFLSGRPGGSGGGVMSERRITVADLRRVARSLKEDVDDKTLAMMVEEANGEEGRGSVGRGVGRREFEDVMRRARVFT